METDFITYSRGIIARDNEKGNRTVAHNRGAALASFSKFLGTEKMLLSELSSDVMTQFKEWFVANGRKETTARLYLCQINAMYKEAAKNGIVPKKQLLEGVKLIVPKKTERKLLTVDELHRLRYVDLSNSKAQTFARDMFFFSIYCRGIGFTDLAHIKKSDIKEGKLTYTSQILIPPKITIQWDAAMQEIADRYPSDTEYLFPFIKSDNRNMKSREISRVRENIARALKHIAIRCNLSVVPTLNMANCIYQRAIETVSVSKII